MDPRIRVPRGGGGGGGSVKHGCSGCQPRTMNMLSSPKPGTRCTAVFKRNTHAHTHAHARTPTHPHTQFAHNEHAVLSQARDEVHGDLEREDAPVAVQADEVAGAVEHTPPAGENVVAHCIGKRMGILQRMSTAMYVWWGTHGFEIKYGVSVITDILSWASPLWLRTATGTHMLAAGNTYRSP